MRSIGAQLPAAIVCKRFGKIDDPGWRNLEHIRKYVT